MALDRIRGGLAGASTAAIALLAVAVVAAAEELKYPLAIAANGKGGSVLADRDLPGLWRLHNGHAEVLFQASNKFRTPLNAVRCVAVDAEGIVFAGDSGAREVYRLDSDGNLVPLTGGQIGIPMSIAIAASGDLLVADLEAHRIWQVPATGGAPKSVVEIAAPRAITLDSLGRLWIISQGENQVLRRDAEGKLKVVVAGRPFEFPSAISVNSEGEAFVCDTYAKAVWKLTENEAPIKFAEGEPLVSPVSLTWLDGRLLVVDPRAKAVIEIDSAGKAGIFIK